MTVASEIFWLSSLFQEGKFSPWMLFPMLGLFHVPEKGPVVLCKVGILP